MKYFAYCRVSSEREDKQVLSPESQKRELLTYARKNNLEIVQFFSERGTAYKTGRKAFNEMLALLEKGKADGILVFHLSRIARNSFDGGRVIYMMDEGIIKEILTTERAFTNCSDDKFLMQIHFAMNKKSSDDNSDFVKRDIITKLEKQEFPAKAPIGYVNINKNGVLSSKQYDHRKQELLQKKGVPLKRIELDPIVAPQLRKIFDMALTGNYGLNSLRENAFKLGITSTKGNTLSKSMMHKILSNIFYVGEFRYNDQTWVGVHDPLVTQEEFSKLQVILGNRSRPKSTRHNYVFTMFFNCECCGGPLSGDHQKGNNYLRCLNAKHKDGMCSNTKNYREDQIEAQVIDLLSDLQISQEVVDWSLFELEKVYASESKRNLTALQRIQNNIHVHKKQLTHLNQKWLSPNNALGNLLSDEEYRDLKYEIQRKIKRAENSYECFDSENDNWFLRCQEFFQSAKVLADTFQKGNPNEKRTLLQAIGCKFVIKDGKVTLTLKEPYVQLHDTIQKVKVTRTKEKKGVEHDNAMSEAEKKLWQHFLNLIRTFYGVKWLAPNT